MTDARTWEDVRAQLRADHGIADDRLAAARKKLDAAVLLLPEGDVRASLEDIDGEIHLAQQALDPIIEEALATIDSLAERAMTAEGRIEELEAEDEPEGVSIDDIGARFAAMGLHPPAQTGWTAGALDELLDDLQWRVHRAGAR